LIVEDDGSGIPANELETFLKPFERLDVARTKPGNGLGLALVAAIAKQHEADLKLENASPGLRVIVSFSEL
jgi:signal transduction histidine kinase